MLLLIWTYTLGRKHINAVNLKSFSQYLVILLDIWGHTLGRNHINVVNVKRLSQYIVIQAYEDTHWEETIAMQSMWKTFSWNCHLISHIKRHTGEKPYQCSQGEKAFSRNSNLISHMRTHNGEKRYQCSQCDKTFVENRNLIYHMMIHTGTNHINAVKV